MSDEQETKVGRSGGKVAFVLWSGGLDSTWVVERLLADDDYQLVFAGYVRVGNNASKAASELQAISRMLPLLGTSPKLEWKGVILDVTFAATNPRLAFKQIPIWLLAAVEAIHFPVDEVAIGYIRSSGDDAASLVPEIERAYAGYRPFLTRDAPRLVFPALGCSKAQIIAELDPRLAACCVHCEYPVVDGESYRRCGRCRTCQAAALRGA